MLRIKGVLLTDLGGGKASRGRSQLIFDLFLSGPGALLGTFGKLSPLISTPGLRGRSDHPYYAEVETEAREEKNALAHEQVSWASGTRRPNSLTCPFEAVSFQPQSHKTSFTFLQVAGAKDLPPEGTEAILAHCSCPSPAETPSPLPGLRERAEMPQICPSHAGV